MFSPPLESKFLNIERYDDTELEKKDGMKLGISIYYRVGFNLSSKTVI